MKIAIKINSKVEFDALMKYYKKLGYKHWNNNSKFILGEYVEFQNDYAFLLEGQQKDFKVLSIREFEDYLNINLTKKNMKIDRQAVFNKFDGKCAYCGTDLEKGWHLDHAIPQWHCEGKNPISTIEIVHCFDNYMPACRSCNLFKSGNGIEGFRKHIESQIEILRRDRPTFRVAERFGLIECKSISVVFHFEN